MIPNDTEIRQLHQKYAWDEGLLRDVTTHCEVVADIASWCVREKKLQVDEERLRAACLLHDIGSYIFLVAKEERRSFYPQHALLGATILREEGVDEHICEIVKTHVLLGLTEDEIKANKIALPYKSFEPQTLEARLLCYADRFSSKGKGVVLNSYDSFLARLKADLPLQAKKFEDWADEFGMPDIEALAKKYKHPIRQRGIL